MRNSDLDRLLRSAANCEDDAPATAPFGFETRVVALWRQSRTEATDTLGELRRFARRIVFAAAVVTLFSGVGAYWELAENEEAGEPSTNAYAIADTAIETGLFQ